MSSWRTPALKLLAHTLRTIKNDDEALRFLRDLCTLDELAELSARWQAAQLLNRGLPYRSVAAKTGLSTTTVTRISHWLHHGEGGYRAALKKG
ncbi:MAG: transposase [Candidatus Magasanikbacteria bacterium]|nr:transposase [Candidatus Magasanikbacteria bacterium]